MRKHTTMLLVGFCAMGCASGAGPESGEWDTGVEAPAEGEEFDGFNDEGSQQPVDPEPAIGRGSLRGDLSYLSDFDVKNAYVRFPYNRSGSAVILEGVADDSPLMVMVDLFGVTFDELEIGRTYTWNQLNNSALLGCVGPAYDTEVVGEEVEMEDVEIDPTTGEPLYRMRIAFSNGTQLQDVHVDFSNPR